VKKDDGFFATFGDDASLKGKSELAKICIKYLFWKLFLSAEKLLFIQVGIVCVSNWKTISAGNL